MALTKVTAAVLEPTAVTDNISNGSISSDKITTFTAGTGTITFS